MNVRTVKQIFQGQKTTDGAGVSLTRLFGQQEAKLFDPFLMMAHFGSENPDEYIAGCPWHPHRGIETVTLMLSGRMEHSDSIGNKGEIASGDIQWMTSGSGIIHQEMPKLDKGKLNGFQLWINMPSNKKMSSPRYQDIRSENIPEIRSNSFFIRVIAGEFEGEKGPINDPIVNPSYFEISLSPNAQKNIETNESLNAFIYVFEGEIQIGKSEKSSVSKGNVALLTSGSIVEITSKETGGRFVFIAGVPIHEPIAWSGPIVMNSREELVSAFKELEEGHFIKND